MYSVQRRLPLYYTAYSLVLKMVEGRVNGLVVIGAGLPRTGTLSTKAALELLLGGPCYHGTVPIAEQKEHQQVWRESFNTGKIDPVMERGVLDGFRAGLDHPFMCWYGNCQLYCFML